MHFWMICCSCVEGDMPKLGDVAVVKGYVKDDMFFQCNATMVKVLSSPQNVCHASSEIAIWNLLSLIELHFLQKFVNSGSNRRKISQQSPSVQPQLSTSQSILFTCSFSTADLFLCSSTFADLTRRNELGRPERRRYSSSSLSSEISSEFQVWSAPFQGNWLFLDLAWMLIFLIA